MPEWRNLRAETLGALTERGYTPDDVWWVGSYDGSVRSSWAEAIDLFNVDYDAGYGGQEIAEDLVVVMNDRSWFQRYEYDGAESWQFVKFPVVQEDARPITDVLIEKLGTMRLARW